MQNPPVIPSIPQRLPISMESFDESFLAKKKSMKRLTCRKCEGHGVVSILKGHASNCPYNNCSCATCSSVMNMRANALIRRFRHRQPEQNSAFLKTIRSKNGNMRLRIVAKSNKHEEELGTTVTYGDNNKVHSNIGRRCSSLTNNQDRSSSVNSLRSCITESTNNSTPSETPRLISPNESAISQGDMLNNLNKILTTTLLQQFLSTYQQSLLPINASMEPSAFSFVQPQSLLYPELLPLLLQ